jgi:hypothetical protein
MCKRTVTRVFGVYLLVSVLLSCVAPRIDTAVATAKAGLPPATHPRLDMVKLERAALRAP